MTIRHLTCALFLLCNSLFVTTAFAETVWVDVRSSFEHNISHVEGDVHIPYKNIVNEITARYPNKDTKIKLYCLSGGRSGKATKWLIDAGYTNVENAGGISDVRERRNLK